MNPKIGVRYQTTDGSFFRVYEEADKHQTKLDEEEKFTAREQRIIAALEKKLLVDRGMSAGNLIKWLAQNVDEYL